MKISLAGVMLSAALVPALPASAAGDDGSSARPLHRVEPEFPRWAMRSGADHGVVNARLTLARDGRVAQVEIVKAEPKRLFDQAVVEALSQWRYAEGRAGRSVDVEVAFKR